MQKQRRYFLFLSKAKKQTCLLGSLFFIFLFLVFINFRVYKKVSLLGDELGLWQERLAAKNKQGQDFVRKLEEINTATYLERMARENLNLKKPGEKVVVFTSENQATTTWGQNRESFWQKIKRFFSF